MMAKATRGNNAPGDYYMQAVRKKRVIVCEDLNFLWDEPELEEMAQIWEQGWSPNYMGEYFGRDPDEVIFALIHLGREGKISNRKGGLFGTK